MRSWKNFRSAAGIDADFDPGFYSEHYPDLQHLRTREQLWRHYERHGRLEGRSKNLAETLRTLEEQHGTLPADFSAAAYKLLNEDLSRGLVHDHQFTRHFLEHGRHEGRPYLLERMDAEPGSAVPTLLEGAWPALFRTAEFVAMSQSWLPRPSLSRAEALRLFVTNGVERLAPISFAHSFDPAFYRQAYHRSATENDVALYRDWLQNGIAAGRAPNERAFLQPYLGYRDYPRGFDWQTYRLRLSGKDRAGIRSRSEALIHFFEQGFATGHEPKDPQDFDLYSAVGDFHLNRSRLSLAAKAYDLAELAGPTLINGSFLYRRGQARRAQSVASAQADFMAALDRNDSPWENTVAAIDGLISENAFDHAFSVLRRASHRWRKRPEFLVCVRRTLQAHYDHARTVAFHFYAAGDRLRGAGVIADALRQIGTEIDALEPLPPRLGPRVNGTIVMLANQDLPQCTHYRVEQKLQQFRHAELKAQAFRESETEDFISALLDARAAIFYRVAATPAVLRAIAYANALGIPTYYEIDDLLFEAEYFPDSFESYEGQISIAEFHGLQLGVPLFRVAMSLCQTAIASTPSLARRMEPLVASGRSVLLRNGLDGRNEAAMDLPLPPRLSSEAVTLFYGTGTKAHNRDFTRDLGPTLLALLDKYPSLRLVIAGYLRLGSEFERHSSRIIQVGFVSDLREYWSLLSVCDINLAVLSPGPMADCKSEIKWLEAAALGVPSIVSATATYREMLVHGVDALLVESAADWHAALEQLIGDATSRARIGEAARQRALRDYGLESGARILAEEFGQPVYLASPELSKEPRLKILICNVFFAPQTYGGATRVVQDNVDYLIDHCPDIEVSIFSADEGREPYGQLRCDTYRERPVFRVSTPLAKLRDWQPFNPDNEKQFREVLARVQPDIVHFHCIQRLTASIVEATARAGIPYVVTLHDGWWISDSQFFMDRDGVLHLPDSDPLNVCRSDGISLTQSMARRQALARLLRGAHDVVSVSERFADVYRRAGIGNVSTVENGVSAILQEPHRLRADGKLALGHIGGRFVHKGATLIEAVLRQGNYDRLALTMIDSTLAPEERYQTLWGETEVLLRGPCQQDEVAGLYADLDILLAPSIWPESFGLVVREAASLGMWVIVSDRGAVGDGIRPGENGVIIDVASPGPLAKLLDDMNTRPQEWRARRPDERATMRAATDQGRELAQIYRGIFHSRQPS